MLDYLVLDIECSKIPHFKPWDSSAFLSSIGVSNGENYNDYFFNPTIGDTDQHLKDLQKFLKSTKTLVGHNLKFDLLWLIHCGFKLPKNIWCTMIAEYLLHGQNANVELTLDATAERYGLGSKVDKMKEYWNNGYQTDDIPLDIHRAYLKQDVLLTQQIYLKQKELIEKAGLTNLMQLTCELAVVLAHTEYTGVPLDKEVAMDIYNNTALDKGDFLQRLIDLVGFDFNPTSSKQLSAILFGGELQRDGRETYTVTLKSGIQKEKSRKCKITEKIKGLGFTHDEAKVSKATGLPSTGKDVLNSLVASTKEQKEFLSTLLGYKNCDKVMSTLLSKDKKETGWLSSLSLDGRLHGNFNQTVTVTGRLSSTNPNLQNLPRGGTSPLKKCIKPKHKDWVILNADLAQVEWRQAGELSGDKVMLQELKDGVDIHSANAVALFGVSLEDKDCDDEHKRLAFKNARQTSKTVSFRLLYGGNAYGFYMDSNMPSLSLKEWETIVDNFYKKYKGLKQWQDKVYKEVLSTGFTRTISNRIFSFKGLDLAEEQIRKEIKRKCANFPVQGSSADVLNCCAVELFNSDVYKKTRSNILMFVHDSIVMEVHKDDVKQIVSFITDMFNRIPELFKERFGYEYSVPMGGDTEVGLNYKDVVSCDEQNVEKIIQELFETNNIS